MLCEIMALDLCLNAVRASNFRRNVMKLPLKHWRFVCERSRQHLLSISILGVAQDTCIMLSGLGN